MDSDLMTIEDKELVEIANRHDIRFMFNRFDSDNIKKAFRTAHELNSKVELVCLGIIEKDGKKYKRMSKTVWRVGKNYDRQVVIEVDNHAYKNLLMLYDFYTLLLGKDFNVFKTLHGYHLIQKVPYKTYEEWVYGNCLLLNPFLKLEDLPDYVKKIMAFDDSKRIKDTEKGTQKLLGTKEDFIRDFKMSGLWHGTGDFDILYTVRGIYFKKYTLRISKKVPNDIYILMDINEIKS